ncbi:MAG TPA: molybdenum cofactor biosynthesis protein MoaE [Myxococcales bacterium]|nr:molybdenum cofactor biosynthesis protein MoaE [Myxococcales bacterium]HAN31283.1 molybdenum cofactor biosynthesis protein MoaE [Myxococcales bacterium]
MGKLTIHYFAAVKAAVGVDKQTLSYVPGETLAQLRIRLTSIHSEIATLLPACRFAIGDDFADDGQSPSEGDNLYVLPPVSGGAGSPIAPQRADVVERPLQAGEASDHLAQKGAGALVTFTGVVRDHNRGRQVTHLDFEAHLPLARKELLRIVDDAIERFNLVDAFAIHRVGHCPLGSVVVDIAVSGAHRPESFEACRYIIDELKRTVPIWKRETHQDGSEWLSQTP